MAANGTHLNSCSAELLFGELIPVQSGNGRQQMRIQRGSSLCFGFFMADAPRITVEELKMRMEAGEDFTLIDVRNPEAWAQSDTMLPEAIRIPLDKLNENLDRIPKGRPAVAYCT